MPAATKSIKVPLDGGPRKFSTIPQEVLAVQFNDWSSAVKIFSFIDGFMFVPRGYDHELRQEHEYERGTVHVLEGAAEYLVFRNPTTEYRIDLGYWIVKHQDNSIEFLLPDAFSKKYAESLY